MHRPICICNERQNTLANTVNGKETAMADKYEEMASTRR